MVTAYKFKDTQIKNSSLLKETVLFLEVKQNIDSLFFSSPSPILAHTHRSNKKFMSSSM